MKIKLKTSLSGPLGSWQAGETVDWDEAEGKRLIAAGFAESVESTSAQVNLPEEADAKTAKKSAKSK